MDMFLIPCTQLFLLLLQSDYIKRSIEMVLLLLALKQVAHVQHRVVIRNSNTRIEERFSHVLNPCEETFHQQMCFLAKDLFRALFFLLSVKIDLP